MNKTHKSLDVTSSDVDEWVRFANELADSARTIARRYFRTRTLVESKSDATPVTVADREIETVLRAALAQRYPDHGIIGEEYGAHVPNNPRSGSSTLSMVRKRSLPGCPCLAL